MKKIFLFLAFSIIAIGANAQKTTTLFNGENLNGWSLFTKDMGDIPNEEFGVKNGCVDLSGKFGYIYTNETYSNYTLTVEWRWEGGEGTNSGVFIGMKGDNKAWPSCYEAQLAHGRAGNLIHMGGSTSDDYNNKEGESINKDAINKNIENAVGEWNKLKIISTNNSVTVYVNDKKQNEITNISNIEGHIGLQSEGKGVQFRNVVLTAN